MTLTEKEKQELAKQIEADLLKLYDSPILNLGQLQRALNYRSVAAVKQAINRNTFPVSTFVMPNRRNRFALAKDVAAFLANQAFNRPE